MANIGFIGSIHRPRHALRLDPRAIQIRALPSERRSFLTELDVSLAQLRLQLGDSLGTIRGAVAACRRRLSQSVVLQLCGLQLLDRHVVLALKFGDQTSFGGVT